MGLKIRATVELVGAGAGELAREGLVVLFGSEVPSALREYCFVIGSHELRHDIVPGDVLSIDEERYSVAEVGPYANENFRNLGHMTLNFAGSNRKDGEILGGSIYLDRSLTSLPHELSRIEICAS